MLPFFRKIRYRLAKENQFLKYSRYAIGEIVLVVIGILIALQINNWNEERKQRKSEIQFLNRLKSDLLNDKKYLKIRRSDSEEVDELHFMFISRLYEEQNNMSDVIDLFQLIRLNSELLNSQNSTYNEMIFSGKLDILTNENLKNDLVNYYHENEEVAKHVAEFNEFSVECMLQMINEVPNMERVANWNDLSDFYASKNFDFNSDWSFLNDVNSTKFQKLELVINVYRNKHRTFSEYFKKLSKRSDALIIAIQNDLNQ